MKRNRMIAIGAAAIGLLFAAAVWAQSLTFTQVTNVNPTTDLIQILPNGQPGTGAVFATPAKLTSTAQVSKVTPTAVNAGTGYAVGYVNTFGNYQAELLLKPATTMSYIYVGLATAPSDGARQCVFTTAAITAFNFIANSGQTINSGITTLAANTRACYTYSASNATWDRSQ